MNNVRLHLRVCRIELTEFGGGFCGLGRATERPKRAQGPATVFVGVDKFTASVL